MDTVSAPVTATHAKKSKEPAIVVDSDDLERYPELVSWLSYKQQHAEVIVLVNDPLTRDFVPGLYNQKFEASVVLRNSTSKPLPGIAFKTAALCTVQDLSNLVPVVAFDESEEVLDMYDDAGVLVTTQLREMFKKGK